MADKILYHVWFATKRRKWLLQGEIPEAVKNVLRETARSKGIDLLACETMVDHVHIMVRTELASLPKVMQALKGISSKAVFEKFPEIKLDAHVNNFWQRHYAFKPVPEEAINDVAEYIRTQSDRPEKYER
ncbi:MAG: IS200/IS605 family transposase [Chloroflexi bacterium]|nr:IS200/IS605 family transposase [Chloroflexota bacterium]